MTRCADWLMKDEVGNNGILSITKAIAEKKTAFGQDAWLATVERNNEVTACLLNVSPDGLVVSKLPTDSWAAVSGLLGEAGIEFSKISGPLLSAVGIAEYWSATAGVEWLITHQWRSYTLTSLTLPKRPASGSLRFAVQKERKIIEEWGKLYEEEKPAPVSVTKFLLYKLDEEELYVWDDGGLKTIVAVSGKTENCARVSAVFTPKYSRGKGYASIAVGLVTKELLDAGKKWITLLVDKHDPQVMRIYEKLGYKAAPSKANIFLRKT